MALAKRKISNIESESLEAHVALCAERYQSMNDKLDKLDDRVGKIESVIAEIKTYIVGLEKTAMSKLLGWAGWAIASLLSLVMAIGAYEYKNLKEASEVQKTEAIQKQ
jgi:hypothetical protein